jgi:Lipocalin-like domain
MYKLMLALAIVPVLSFWGHAAENDLYGTYRLVSTVTEMVDTGQIQTETNENGFITYGSDGRMSVLIIRGDRPKPESLAKMTDQQRADLFRTMVAYAGTYKFDGKTVEHHIDISANEISTGTINRRMVKREGDRIVLTTPPSPRAMDGKITIMSLVWERVK